MGASCQSCLQTGEVRIPASKTGETGSADKAPGPNPHPGGDFMLQDFSARSGFHRDKCWVGSKVRFLSGTHGALLSRSVGDYRIRWRSSDNILLRFEHETRRRRPVRVKPPRAPRMKRPVFTCTHAKTTHLMTCLDQLRRTSRQPGAQAGNVSPVLSPSSASGCPHKRTCSGAPTAQTSAPSRLSFTLVRSRSSEGESPSPSARLTLRHSSPPNVTRSDL